MTPQTPGAVDQRPGGPERKRVLFVDDDPFLLEGLRDALRSYRDRWAMTFVSDGERAVAALDAEPQDVVITDLRMPRLDGAALLEIIRERCPTAVRIVLSGHAEMRVIGRAATTAHRLIAKPCETADLVRVIERSCALAEMAGRVELSRSAIGASALPSVPRVCVELAELLGSGTAGAADAALVIEQDIGMAAKVLQLANSAYFGRRTPVSDIAEAVAYLGLDAVKALVLQAAAFQEFTPSTAVGGFDIDDLHRHCTRVAQLATRIAADTGAGKDAFTAGLLHDVGLLVMASCDGGKLERSLVLAREDQRSIREVEFEQYGVTHAEVGAHLLALWGLPHQVVEAVAGHDNPAWLRLPFDLVTVVHVANALVEEVEAQGPASPAGATALDIAYLEDAGLAGRLARWRQRAADRQ